LNDDTVAKGMGFGKHPHENMEIVSIPLSGDLHHKDSTGRDEIIRQNDVQIMSAGSGIAHSETNANHDRDVKFLQLWVFPKERNIEPRYEQKTFKPEDRLNKIVTVVAPDDKMQYGSTRMHGSHSEIFQKILQLPINCIKKAMVCMHLS
jgi:redox-sensitive bicupin YhaK (pirin superfamily)